MTVELPLTPYQLALLALALALAAGALGGALLFARCWTRDSALRRGALRALLVGLSTSATLLALEVGCWRFGVESHSIDFTLAAGRWYEEHWRPINRLGLRDPELDVAALSSTRLLVVVGDSFAAGHGIDDADDRVSGVLRRRLAPEWTVLTLAKPGWNTRQELDALRRLPWRPDVVVLWWFLNDVESAAASHGLRFAPDLRVQAAWASPLVERSYLANFWYWRLAQRRDRELAGEFSGFLEASFGDPVVWASHEAELDALIEAVHERDAKLLAVLAPELSDVARSVPYVEQAAAAFSRRGVPTLDLAEAYRGRDPASLVVSPRDAHPNAAVHADVAARVLEALAREGWLAPR